MLQAIRQGFRNRDPRTRVVLPARMRSGARWADACIHNVSSRGMMVASNDAPAPGSYIELRRGPNIVVGRVVWRRDRFFGLRAQDRIDLDLLRRASTADAANDGSAVERRADRRLGEDARRARTLERSRAIAKASQFVTLALLCVGAALFAGHAVHEALRAPVSRIAAVMPD
ncbi:PilZ domain-containing protein [Sphingomonas sp. HF-S4]|uniref:PilZ domain-containing protein n=1 Tax=Sphingomonas agrestis TaxID=3080540 RepID=A0ABU3Y2Z9_9SPHN|nr:PilZ domain-containing protein [Sphingomonas sp. HF-S4]MDV3455749.1 PilZ domain-containing protein [Sphingomonas sp. HF-S4]